MTAGLGSAPRTASAAARTRRSTRPDATPRLPRLSLAGAATQFNIAEVCCARWARQTPRRSRSAASTRRATSRRSAIADLQASANRLANALQRLGVERGDRVAIVMPQRFETAVAHMAIYQLGAVAMPLSMLFGPDALEYRLQRQRGRAGDRRRERASPTCSPRAPHARRCDACSRWATPQGRATSTGSAAARPRRAEPSTSVDTRADDAAVLIYTSGTTGPPKGALIPHRALIGNLTGFVCSQNWFPQRAARRGVLVAGRLGLDRRADGRAAADALLRPRRSSPTRAASSPSARSS